MRTSWAQLTEEICACNRCRLCETRNNVVPGEGDTHAALMFIGFFPRTAAASLVQLVYWAAVLLYLPLTIPVLLVFGFWLPCLIAAMILYPGLDKVFQLEKTLRTRRDAELAERMAGSGPVFSHNDQ